MASQAFKPEPFKGSTDQDVDDWLDTFSRYAEFANWESTEKYSTLKSLMQEGAVQWLRRQDLEQLNTFELLKTELENKYRMQPVQRFPRRQRVNVEIPRTD